MKRVVVDVCDVDDSLARVDGALDDAEDAVNGRARRWMTRVVARIARNGARDVTGDGWMRREADVASRVDYARE